MKKIGQILKEARIQKDYSLHFIGEKTKIKKNFIEAIENHNWQALPAFPTVLGFVKSISGVVGVDEKTAIATLKRDYPPQRYFSDSVGRINPKPDVSSKFSWSPKLTFTLGIIGVLIVVFGYLVFQYFQFISPPKLNIDSPKENQAINGNSVLVFGSTNGDAKIMVNNQPVIVTDDGKFSVNIGITLETHEIDVVALSRSGKMTEVRRKIVVQ